MRRRHADRPEVRFHPGLVILLPAVLAACGGGGGGGGSAVPVTTGTTAPVISSTPPPTPVPTTPPVTVPVGAVAVAAPLGSLAGESASLGLAAATSGAGTATAQLALAAPAGAPAVQSSARLPRAIGTTNLTALLFIAFMPSATLTFASTPSFTFVFPSGFAIAAGTAAYVAEYDPTQPGVGWQPFLGPATVVGTTIAFSSVTRSVTFQANQTYLFVLFTTGAVIGVPTAAPSSSPTPLPSYTPTPAPTPASTPTPTPSGSASPSTSPSPSPSPSPSGSAAQTGYACPASDSGSGVARGNPAAPAEAARRIPRRTNVAPVTGLLAVTYERATATSNTRAISARESQLGAMLVHSYDFPHTGRVTRVVAVPAGQAASIAAMLRSQPGVEDVGTGGGRRSTSTVTQPYVPSPHDPYFAGFSGSSGPYDEAASIPGQWDMHAIGLDYAFGYSQSGNAVPANAGALGSAGIKIAIIDTGEDTTHPELSGKIVAQGCFITGPNKYQSVSSFTTDPDGHGTDVSGIAAAATGNGIGFVGAGGAVSLVGYRVFPTPDNNCLLDGSSDPRCGADTADIASAINDAVNNQHVNVISMSLGGGSCTNGVDQDSTERQAVAEAIAANVIVVAASGNSGTGTVDAPACDTGVIAVGASSLADGIANGTNANWNGEYVAGYSNYGSPGANVASSSAWGIVAPGGDPNSDGDADDLHWIENIWTSTPFSVNDEGTCTGDFGGGTTIDCRTLIAGTSMATPHVAGAAALILSVKAATYGTPSAMKALLCATADNIKDGRQGCGRLNVYRAMATALGDPNPP